MKKTILTRDPAVAAGVINDGGLVAFPTETVYGLGADAFDDAAVRKIFAAKRRPPDNPLIVHIAKFEQLAALVTDFPPAAHVFMRSFFPGPLTLVLPRAAEVSSAVSAGLNTIGVRMPGSAMAIEFLSLCGTAVAAPSANLSGRPSPTTWAAVMEDLNGRIDCVLQGDPTTIGLESTVVDCTSAIPLVLRQGSISIEQLRDVVRATELYISDTANTARSPGMKHRHYSPTARVVVVRGEELQDIDQHAAYIGLAVPPGRFAFTMQCQSPEEYASSVFEFFRECDRRRIEVIYCQAVTESGIGGALMDRLERAARG